MRYFIFKLKNNSCKIYSSFILLDEADLVFCQNTILESVSNWVESFGHYSCNDDETGEVIIVLIDKDFEIPKGRENEYEFEEFKKLHLILLTEF